MEVEGVAVEAEEGMVAEKVVEVEGLIKYIQYNKVYNRKYTYFWTLSHLYTSTTSNLLLDFQRVFVVFYGLLLDLIVQPYVEGL